MILELGSRRAPVLLIALTPLLSVALGALMTAAGIGPGFMESDRMAGATGTAAAFAVRAFAGFAVALHEMSRPSWPFAGALAVVNLALVIISGTRMAIAASAVFLITYLALSDSLRQRLRAHRARTASGVAIVVAVLLWYWPTLEARLFQSGDLEMVLTGDTDLTVNLSRRDDVWEFYFEEFTFSPLFGRGIGAGFVAAADWVPWPRKTPHNEYLHLLVSVGAIGFILCAAAIALWYRRLLQMVSDNDRLFLIALVPAMGLFAVTEDVLVFSTGLALFAYLGVLLTKRSTQATFPRAGKRRRSRSRRAIREGQALTPRGDAAKEPGTSPA